MFEVDVKHMTEEGRNGTEWNGTERRGPAQVWGSDCCWLGININIIITRK